MDRQFTRSGPDQLWVTDITEHPTREGKVDCAVVLGVFSRRVVGWSISALGMRTPIEYEMLHRCHVPQVRCGDPPPLRWRLSGDVARSHNDTCVGCIV